MKKGFDCVEMMHHGAEKIREETKDMTFEEKIAYWQQRSREFREEQEKLLQQAQQQQQTEPQPTVGDATQ